MKDEEKLFCKDGDVIIKADHMDITKEFMKMPAFKPVLEILDNELPEYANLAQEKTGKIHCKAVRKLNEIQPTTVKDEEKYRIRRSKISAKLLAAATPPYFARMVM